MLVVCDQRDEVLQSVVVQRKLGTGVLAQIPAEEQLDGLDAFRTQVGIGQLRGVLALDVVEALVSIRRAESPADDRLERGATRRRGDHCQPRTEPNGVAVVTVQAQTGIDPPIPIERELVVGEDTIAGHIVLRIEIGRIWLDIEVGLLDSPVESCLDARHQGMAIDRGRHHAAFEHERLTGCDIAIGDRR